MADSPYKVRDALHLALSELPDNAKPKLFRRYNEALRELDGLEEQFEVRDTAIRAAIEMGLDHPDALETLHAAIRGSSPAKRPRTPREAALQEVEDGN